MAVRPTTPPLPAAERVALAARPGTAAALPVVGLQVGAEARARRARAARAVPALRAARPRGPQALRGWPTRGLMETAVSKTRQTPAPMLRTTESGRTLPMPDAGPVRPTAGPRAASRAPAQS